MIKSRTLGAVAALGVLVLTGCGAVQPGAAVEVGDQTISLSRLDEVSSDFCTAVAPQLESQAETINNAYLRSGIAGTLALQSVAEQVADQYGVEPGGEQYLQALKDAQAQTATVPEDVRDTVREVQLAPAYVEAVQEAVGRQLLDGDGEYNDFVNAGGDAFNTWIAENGVEFDPALGIALVDGIPKNTDTALSFAVSDAAKNGQEEQPNSVLARQLPTAHRCGR